ncbi:MAG: hypothetical protein IPP81_19080 [Chitinophagaceae bacterium]|nr:hypothetical protein [Chitinophagaceae bacterium]
MNPLSKTMKLVLCVGAGFLGFVIIPGIWIGWQQSMGFKTPGSIFIIILWAATAAGIRGIWKYQPDRNDKGPNDDKFTLKKD